MNAAGRAMIAAAGFALAAAAAGAERPDYDGPGAFGPLHDTFALHCLEYLGPVRVRGTLLSRIRDPLGRLHRPGIGDFVGEGAGVLRRIDRDMLVVERRVLRDGEWTMLPVTLDRSRGRARPCRPRGARSARR